jgi:hypothetical protein
MHLHAGYFVQIRRNKQHSSIKLMTTLDSNQLSAALLLLAERMDMEDVAPLVLVVCGGSALIARGFLQRTTKDVDVVALADETGQQLLDPEPLPADLLAAAERTRIDLGLPESWLNNGPSRGIGGLYHAGLPEGLLTRAEKQVFGPRLTVLFVGRLDQIIFKLPAAVDHSGGRHLADLLALQPTSDELIQAATWACNYDPSEGFALCLRELLKEIGHHDVAVRV